MSDCANAYLWYGIKLPDDWFEQFMKLPDAHERVDEPGEIYDHVVSDFLEDHFGCEIGFYNNFDDTKHVLVVSKSIHKASFDDVVYIHEYDLTPRVSWKRMLSEAMKVLGRGKSEPVWMLCALYG